MSAWPAKDPDAVLDYTFTIPLDEGDAVASHTFELVTGTVAIDDEDIDEATITARLSGGADGETSVFKAGWVTTAGRHDEEFITLLVAANDYVALELTGYVKPLPQHLLLRYPAFAEVPIATIQYWLTDAERAVDRSWTEGDYAAGLMALAAHNMAASGLGTNTATASLPAGLTKLKSASVELAFDEETVKAKAKGGYDSTRYGIEFKRLLRLNVGGPQIVPSGTVPVDPYPVANR